MACSSPDNDTGYDCGAGDVSKQSLDSLKRASLVCGLDVFLAIRLLSRKTLILQPQSICHPKS